MKQNVRAKSKRKRCKKGRGPRKGGSYERLKLKELSFWWTGKRQGDIFQRTSGSGSKSTVTKSRVGALDLIQISTKINYPKFPFIVDFKHYADLKFHTLYTGNSKTDGLYSWIVNCKRESKRVRRPWLLIARQNRQPDILICEIKVFKALFQSKAFNYSYASKVNVAILLVDHLLKIEPKIIEEKIK